MQCFTLLVFLTCAAAFTFVNPAVPGSFPLYSHLTQINLFENLQRDIWLKNYSLMAVSGCPPSASPDQQAAIPGKILLYNYGEGGGPCTYSDPVNYYNQFNPIGHMFFNIAAAMRAIGGNNPDFPVSNERPVWHVGGDVTVQLESLQLSVPFALFAPNSTINLSYPDINPALQGLFTVGWLQVNYFATAFGLIGMLIASWKLGIFIQAFGIQFSIPQIVLACSFCGSFFLFLVFGLFGVIVANSQAIVSFDAQEAVTFMPLGFSFSGIFVLSFYFLELSQLTSTQSIAGLAKMRIPALIVLAVAWISIIAIQATNASDPIQNGSYNVNALNMFYFAWLGVITPFFATALLVWGSVSLILALSDSTNKGPSIRISVLSSVLIVLLWTAHFIFFLFAYGPGLDLFTTPMFKVLTPIEFFAIRNMLATLAYGGICIVLALNFSVSVAKEIEMSKSGTSSTSSGKSSSSSSSSSMSGSQDPVIEL